MSLTPGIYRIYQWGPHTVQPQLLTLDDQGVTVFPPGVAPANTQEWHVGDPKDGQLAIQNRSGINLSRSLSYEGEPAAGKIIIAGPLTDFPTRRWQIELVQERSMGPYYITAPDTNLKVAISPVRIFPPQLALFEPGGLGDKSNAWVFELLSPDPPQ